MEGNFCWHLADDQTVIYCRLHGTLYMVHGAQYGTTSLMRLSELRGSPCCICTERELLATDDLCVAPPPLLSCRECWDTLDVLLVGDE